ncbi:ABC transporter ATP-binding protein [Terrihabitans sp. B22-R8]|uniref:ABC transporter ATP-binding protein n=1 Tax=Terrihabitans sp. B22-R8 TaxID=3425128 RepID=UPI00403C3F6E
MRIDASDLTVCIKGRAVVDRVSLTLGGGEFVGLIGPNGAGKTSLVRALAGLIEPQSGTVSYDGVALDAIPLRERACDVAFLAQAGPVHWPLRARQVAALGRLPHRNSTPAENDVAIDRALSLAGVTELQNRTMDRLSGGERARILIARALAVEAPIMVADEPNAALDPYHQLAIMEVLQAQARSGAGILVVLHDLTLAARFCDRLIVMAEGRKIADGTPADVLTGPNLAEAYSITAKCAEEGGISYVLPLHRLERSEP